MTAHYERCAHCGQWISPLINHYVVVEDEHGHRHFLHLNPCLAQYSDEHIVLVLEEHRNQRI